MNHLQIDGKTVSKSEYWRSHLDRQKASSLSQAAYCKQEGLKLPNFQYWKRRLATKTSTQLRLVPITLSASPEKPKPEAESTARIHHKDLVLEVPAAISKSHLVQLISAEREAGGEHVAH